MSHPGHYPFLLPLLFPFATALSFCHCSFLLPLLFPFATALSLQLPSPICRPERSRISCFTALPANAYVVLGQENPTHLTEAATLDRKSGGGEGSAVRPSEASLP